MENTNPLTRRQFIGQNAATIALAAAPMALPGPMRAQSDTPAKKLRIGIAGGRFGAMFYWHEHPGCTVAGVTDLMPQRREILMKVYQCAQSYRSLEEMVKDPSLDAIGVFTDGPKHLSMSCWRWPTGSTSFPRLPPSWPPLRLKRSIRPLSCSRR